MSKQTKREKKNEIAEKRIKYFIEMLDIKRDTNMTRVYSAISQSGFLNPNYRNN